MNDMVIQVRFKFKNLIALLMVTLFIQRGLGQDAISYQSLRGQIDRIIRYDTDIPTGNHHGFIIGIIDGDRHWILDYPGTPADSLNGDMVFELGGLSQVFTAHYLTELADKGNLDLDDPITISGISLPGTWKEVTWRQCFQYATGLPRVIPGLAADQSPDNPYGNIAFPDLISAISRIPFKPGTFRYSPHPYAMIQAALEMLFDQPYESQINDFCNGLGLINTGIITPKPEVTATGYRRNGMVAIPWHVPAYQASLGLSGTMNDLMHYAHWLLNHAGDPRFENLFQPTLKTHLRGRIDMAGGWYVLKPVRRSQIYTHSGQTGGHKAYLGFVPATQTAVMILGQSPEETNDLGLLILRMINDSWKRKKPDEKE